ncbi:PAS domain-containing protein [Arenibacter amylolyticus]|uniref:PAS domain-containing protein n=1 Tax=Arenibacter amylolyticus TaxID=1406873 RepID=UPI000A389864|nr:PAS domain-containing protein [Arenibacter amylolyticus]
MALKRLVSSPKFYVIMLIVATALLIFIGGISYKQIDRLNKSAEAVSRIIEVEIHINQLFTAYSQMQAAELKNHLLQDSTRLSSYRVYRDKAMDAIITLEELTKNRPNQQKILESISVWQDSLFLALNQLTARPLKNPVNDPQEKEKIGKVSATMTQLNLLRNQLQRAEQSELEKRKAQYATQITLTPLTTLFLSFFALCIFVVSFIQINILRKKTTRAEEFLKSILAGSDNIIGYLLPIYNNTGDRITDFKIAFTNEKIESVLGKNPEELANTKVSEVVPAYLRDKVFQELVHVMKEGAPRKFESFLKQNGSTRWFKTTATLMDEGVLTTTTDSTTEKVYTKNLKHLNKRLEERNKDLGQTKAFLNNILESASNTVSHLESVKDESGNIIDFKYLFSNKEIENLTGISPNSLIGKSISEVFPLIHSNGLFDLMVKCATEGSVETLETQYHLMGKWKWIHTTINKLNTGITVTSYDTTAIVKAQQELLELNEQLTIQNSILKDAESVAKIGSYRWDVATGEASMSDNFYRLLECEIDEFVPTFDNYRPYVHPKDQRMFEEKLQYTLDKKHDNVFVYRIVTKTGKIKHFQHSGHFVQDKFVGVVKDITKELKDAQKLQERNLELKRSNKELESFNRVASHDLQEPLRKIQIFISRITEGNLEKNSERNLEYLHKISSSANRMQNLIKHLLAYSRLKKNKKDRTLIDLNELVEKILEDYEAPINEKKINILLHPLPDINGIPFQIEQLFSNLLSNSIKYTSVLEPPRIEIGCQKIKRKNIEDDFQKKAANYYCITVKDNGIGFDPTNAEKIFGLFQRLHQKNEYSGTGIGLAICKKIVENHRGHIVADGTLNKGAIFRIYLPA